MSPATAGVIGIGLLVALFLLRMPVAFAMALVGSVGFAYLTTPEAALALLGRDIFDSFSSYPLSVIPMFILMGTFAFASGISRRLYSSAYTWVGQFRGGLTIATVLACSGFAAICGSTAATAATMGRIALPELRQRTGLGHCSGRRDPGHSYSSKHGPHRLRDLDRGIHWKAFCGRHPAWSVAHPLLCRYRGLALLEEPSLGSGRPPNVVDPKSPGRYGNPPGHDPFSHDHRRIVLWLVQSYSGWSNRGRRCAGHRLGPRPTEVADIH